MGNHLKSGLTSSVVCRCSHERWIRISVDYQPLNHYVRLNLSTVGWYKNLQKTQLKLWILTKTHHKEVKTPHHPIW